MRITALHFMLGGTAVTVAESEKDMKTKKYWKMGTRRQILHRKIYDALVNRGYACEDAYEIASKITNWA